MEKELQKQMLQLLDVLMKQQKRVTELIENMPAICSSQHIIISILCQYDPNLQAHFCKMLTHHVNRPHPV